MTASGGLGPAAIALLATLSNKGLGNSGVVEEMELAWLVPSHGKYWHRRFRGIAMEGWTNIQLSEHVQELVFMERSLLLQMILQWSLCIL